MANVADHYRILKHPLPMIDNKAQISLQAIYDKLTELHAQLKNLPETSPYIYDNKFLMSLLGVKDRYLKRLHDNGLSATPATATNTGTPKPTLSASSPAATSPRLD